MAIKPQEQDNLQTFYNFKKADWAKFQTELDQMEANLCSDSSDVNELNEILHKKNQKCNQKQYSAMQKRRPTTSRNFTNNKS